MAASGSAEVRSIVSTLLAVAGLIVACGAGAAEGAASGTVTYQTRSGGVTATPTHAFLLRGPDAVDALRMIRRLVLSASDLGARIAACKTMSCVDAELGEGITVDISEGPRLDYWVVFNGQKVQYSGTAPPAALRLRTDTPSHLAGKLVIDDSSAGGPRVDVEFDASMTREFR